jgi:hypothetical protein
MTHAFPLLMTDDQRLATKNWELSMAERQAQFRVPGRLSLVIGHQ